MILRKTLKSFEFVKIHLLRCSSHLSKFKPIKTKTYHEFIIRSRYLIIRRKWRTIEEIVSTSTLTSSLSLSLFNIIFIWKRAIWLYWCPASTHKVRPILNTYIHWKARICSCLHAQEPLKSTELKLHWKYTATIFTHDLHSKIQTHTIARTHGHTCKHTRTHESDIWIDEHS